MYLSRGYRFEEELEKTGEKNPRLHNLQGMQEILPRKGENQLFQIKCLYFSQKRPFMSHMKEKNLWLSTFNPQRKHKNSFKMSLEPYSVYFLMLKETKFNLSKSNHLNFAFKF